MNFNEHYNLRGKHAYFSPSSPSWLRYDQEKVESYFFNQQNKQKGTELHQLASDLIKHRVKLPKIKKAINQFVNDAIGFGLKSEKLLYFSDNFFGTADAIDFNKDGVLRIFDLKTGFTPVKMEQLEIYAALFCLEYGMIPNKIGIELRIYQGNDIIVEFPKSENISYIMDTIQSIDKQLELLKDDMNG